MEFDVPQDQLVKTSISKETAKLNKEINQLRAALNRQAGLKVLKTGKSNKKKGGGKTRGQQQGASVKKPKPKSTPKSASKSKQKPKPKSQAKPNNTARKN
jgi:hypothetical protein